MNTITRLAVVASVVTALAACESRVTGNEGNFQFSYQSDDRIFDFNKPIAVGAFLDIDVEDAGDQAPIQLDGASTDDPALEVVEVSGNTVTVQGTAEGNVLLEVTGARDGGEKLTDSVNLLARIPDLHNLRHTCGADGMVAYRAGTQPYVPFDFEMENGQPVIGYGYYPVTLSAGSVDMSHLGHQYMRIDLEGIAAGSHTLTSDLDGTALDMTIVEEAAIDGVAEPIAFVLEDIDVGDRNPFYVLPMVGDRTVCQAVVDMTVTSNTPDICAVRNANSIAGESTDAGKETGWFEIEGVAEGTCEYTVTYPGSGASQVFTYPIEP